LGGFAVAVIVSAVEADLWLRGWTPAPYVVQEARVYLMTPSGDNSAYFHFHTDGSGPRWTYFVAGTTGSVSGANGTGRLTFAENGDDVDWEFLVDGVSKATGALTGGASYEWSRVAIVLMAGVGYDWTRNLRIAVTASGVGYEWLWDATSELDDWTTWSPFYQAPQVTGGYLGLQASNSNAGVYKDFVGSPTLSATIQAPGILRRAMATGGSISTDYELGADTAILSGTADKHPEILALNASSAALAMVFQRDEQGESNVYYSTGGGAEAAGAWGTVQQVRAARAHPCACVLKPTHDAYVIAYNSADLSSYGQRLAWNGSSYDIGSEVTVVNGTAAAERGAVAWDAGKGRLHFTYADTDGAVQILTSDDCGATWA
jgi:uncharacterized Zn-binding protein involved in type VI secretion